MNKITTAVFCDFDGTISRRDVGYNLFHHFSGGKNDELLPAWIEGTLSTRDCLRQEAAMVHASPETILSFLDQFEIDRGFAAFASRCRDAGVPVIVMSEGLDFYIRRILSRYGLQDLPLNCNAGFLEKGTIRVEFPNENHVCRTCGNCKGERMAEYREAHPGCRTVFVGDGYSDACAVREADMVFAKKDLLDYCGKHNIEYNSYRTFEDVADTLHNLGILLD
jgi:2,3-diketo-5-methylthio-1-phosphopentane phosphatase